MSRRPHKKRSKPGRPAREPSPPEKPSTPTTALVPANRSGGTSSSETNSVVADAAFWRSVLLSLETQPVGVDEIVGASGLKHRVVDVGVDRPRERVVLLTDVSDPKIAAFLQSDVQSVYPQQKVVVARTVLANVGTSLPPLRQMLPPDLMLDLSKLKDLGPQTNSSQLPLALLPAFLEALGGDRNLRTHSPGAFFLQLVMQLSRLNWGGIALPDEGDSRVALAPLFGDLSPDPDSELGICPIPVHAMKAVDVEAVKSSPSHDVARELLQRLGVFEYFFPKKAELALGLVDRGLSDIGRVESAISLAPQHGHPLEDSPQTIHDVVRELKTKGFIVEGELGFSTTIQGQEARALVKFRPKESLLVKLKNIIGVAAPLLKFFVGK